MEGSGITEAQADQLINLCSLPVTFIVFDEIMQDALGVPEGSIRMRRIY